VDVSLEQAYRGKCSNGSHQERRACSEPRKAKRVWKALKSIPYRFKYYKVLSHITTCFWGEYPSFLTLYQLAARTNFLAFRYVPAELLSFFVFLGRGGSFKFFIFVDLTQTKT